MAIFQLFFVSRVGLSRWCLHLGVVVELECLNDSTGHAGGSLATGRVSQAGRVEEERPD